MLRSLRLMANDRRGLALLGFLLAAAATLVNSRAARLFDEELGQAEHDLEVLEQEIARRRGQLAELPEYVKCYVCGTPVYGGSTVHAECEPAMADGVPAFETIERVAEGLKAA